MSEYGKGLTYCLGLFLAHSERYGYDKTQYERTGMSTDRLPMMWFNVASDHLYELQIPEEFPKELKERIKKLQDKSIHYGHGLNFDIINEEEVDWAISEAKGILLEIDKFYGIEAEKGDCE